MNLLSRGRIAAVSVFLLQGLVQTTAPWSAFADPGERWVKLTVIKHPDAVSGKRTTVFFYPESEYESYKDGAYRQTKLYLKTDRKALAKSWLTRGSKKHGAREYVSWQPEAGDKIQDSAAEALDFSRETVLVAAPKPEPGKTPGKDEAGVPQGGSPGDWVKISHGGKDYYHPKDAKPHRNKTGNFQIDLFDSPGGKKVQSHLFKPKVDAPYTLHIAEGGKPVNVPEGSYKREVVSIPGGAGGPGGPVVVPPKPEPGQAPTVSGTAAGPDDNHPVNRVAKALLPLDGKENDLADRFLKYIWREPWSGGKSFVHPERRKVDDGKPLRGPIAEWVKKNPDQAAVIYYGLGSGQPAPGWVLQDENLRKLLADKPRSDPKLEGFEDSLAECLGRWTTSPGGEPPKHCKNAPAEETEFAIGPLGGGANLLKWVKAYLKDAATESNAIFYAMNISSKELEGRIGSAPPTEGLPTAGPPGDRRLPTGIDVTKPFGVADLFGAWGDPNVLYIDGRFLALVVRTVRTADNPPAYKQQVGLYDITSPDNIYGKRFDLDYAGGEAFKLDDKRPDARQYILEFKPVEGRNDLEISVKRPDDTGPTDGNGGPARIPTLNELFVNRAVKARSYGHQVKMGDKTYYVSGESSNKGSLLFWSEETIQRAIDPNVNPRDLKPEMLAYVNEKKAGEVVNLGDRVPVGPAPGDDPKKAWHWLKWNASLRIWQPELGEAPKVEPAKPPTDGTKPPPDGQKPPGDGQKPPPDGQKPPGDRVLPDGWPDLENYTTTDGRAGALNKALSEELKAKLKFYENKTGAVAGQQIIMMHGKSRLRMAYLLYINSGQDGRVTGKTLGEEILGGRVLMTDSDKGAVYYDLDAVARKMDAVQEPVALPEWNAGEGNVGKYLPEGGSNAVDNVKDMTLLGHILPKAGYPADAVGAIRERAEKVLAKAKPGSFYSLSGKRFDAASKGRMVMSYATEQGAGCAVLWPVLNEESCDSPQNEEGTTGIAFDPARGMLNPFEGFGKPPKLDGVTAVEVVKVEGEAALYRSDVADEKDEKKKTQKWYLVYVVKTVKTEQKDGKAVAAAVGKYRTNYIQVFQAPATRSFRTFPGKDALGIRGVTYDEAKLPNGQFPQGNAFYNEIPKPYRGDSALNKGAIAVHDAPNGEMRSKDPNNNCVGVVLWWKVTPEDALKACRAK